MKTDDKIYVIPYQSDLKYSKRLEKHDLDSIQNMDLFVYASATRYSTPGTQALISTNEEIAAEKRTGGYPYEVFVDVVIRARKELHNQILNAEDRD